MKSWSLRRNVQCAKCPWKKSTNPNDIPNGYSEDKHAALKSTIGKPGDLSGLASDHMRVMACHEEHEAYCIGWLMNQVGPGNNIPLRLHLLSCENRDDIKIVGEQHERFEDTLPRQRRKRKRG